MNVEESVLFTPIKIGPITLRNRSIRAATFESMCENNAPTQQLSDYHTSVSEGANTGIHQSIIYSDNTYFARMDNYVYKNKTLKI